MRIQVVGTAGDLTERPADALSALADIAAADGADRDAWLEKAMAGNGAARRAITVRADPRYPLVGSAVTSIADLHRRAMVLLRSRIRERLERAIQEGDPARYHTADRR